LSFISRANALIESGLRALALLFEGGGALPPDVVQLNDAVFDGAVEPLQTIFCVAQLFLLRKQPVIGGLTLRGLVFDQRLQELNNAVGTWRGWAPPAALAFMSQILGRAHTLPMAPST
jgi:hypothetical protein